MAPLPEKIHYKIVVQDAGLQRAAWGPLTAEDFGMKEGKVIIEKVAVELRQHETIEALLAAFDLTGLQVMIVGDDGSSEVLWSIEQE